MERVERESPKLMVRSLLRHWAAVVFLIASVACSDAKDSTTNKGSEPTGENLPVERESGKNTTNRDAALPTTFTGDETLAQSNAAALSTVALRVLGMS